MNLPQVSTPKVSAPALPKAAAPTLPSKPQVATAGCAAGCAANLRGGLGQARDIFSRSGSDPKSGGLNLTGLQQGLLDNFAAPGLSRLSGKLPEMPWSQARPMPVEEAPKPSPGAQETPPAASSAPGSSSVGLRAKEYGRDGRAVNPNNGTRDWNGWCLGWVNQAFQSQGQRIPELQAETASDAYRQAEANGKIRHGDPPPGSIVFFPEAAGGTGHVGIVNEDGTSYRGTVPPGENPTTIGDRPIPNRDEVAWMMPPEA